MIGRFILGMVSGGILVTGGLVASAALFPMRATEVTDVAKLEAPTAAIPAEDASTEVVQDPVTEPEPVVEPESELVVAKIPAPEAEALAEAASTEPAPEASEAPEATIVPEIVADPVVEAPAAEVAAEPAPELAPEPVIEPEPAAVTAPEADPAPAADPEPEPLPAVEPEIAEVAPEADPAYMPGSRSKPLPGADEPTTPSVGSEADVTPEPGSTLEPTPGLDAAPEGVVVGRLPKIEDQTEGAEGDVEVAGEAADAPEASTDAQPILAYASPFENPDAKPVLAVVLIDSGAADLDRAALAVLPFPVSFALDPLDPATPERAALYRAAGREVVILATGIAYGSQASDVEVAFQSMAQNLPEAVAVMDLATPMFQNQRPLASIVVPVVAAQGRGLLTWDQGLNAADQVARREDVAAAVIFRDLASSGTDTLAIRRILDRAVFKAGQDGRAVVAGTATAETVAALLEWSVEGRAATIALGPLTAAMQVD